jgi:hypothetical protein
MILTLAMMNRFRYRFTRQLALEVVPNLENTNRIFEIGSGLRL